MKRAGRVIRTLLTEGLLAISVLISILMVINLYHPTIPDPYTARNEALAIPELATLAPDSLLNSGDLAALDALPGIGEVLAARIIEARELDGLYTFPEDVMSVKGVGEKKFADIAAYLAAMEATPTDLAPLP